MKNGDKYASAKSLAKLFEEILARHGGDKERAKDEMDEDLGEAWQVEVVVDDEGPEFIPEDVILETKSCSANEKDEMYGKARAKAADAGFPTDDLENEGSERHADEDNRPEDEDSELKAMIKELMELMKKS